MTAFKSSGVRLHLAAKMDRVQGVLDWHEIDPGQTRPCADPDAMPMFFPEPEFGRLDYGPAKLLCAGCPFVEECAADAIRRDEDHGVQGGLTPGDRDQIHGRPRRDPELRLYRVGGRAVFSATDPTRHPNHRPQVDGEKRCTACGIVKPVTEFSANRRRRDGRSTDCLECRAESIRMRRALAAVREARHGIEREEADR